MSVYADINGQTVVKARITFGATGPWFADCVLDTEAAQVTGAVTLSVGGLVLKGTVAADQSGVFVSQRSLRVVGGGGGWSKLLSARAYHNDAGVKALNVAADAAREAGETLGTFSPEAARSGVDYVRQTGPASRVLEDVIGSADWWVDYNGITQVGKRSTNTPAESAYDVTDHNPLSNLVVLAAEDLTVISVGSVISKTLDTPHTVRDLEIIVEAGDIVINAWCGPFMEDGRLVNLFASLVKRFTDGKLFGTYRYRVVRTSGDRVDLQAVRKGAGLPDLSPVSMWPGVAGCHAQLADGAEVLVQFIEGDRTQPIVTHFAGKDGTGFAPVSLLLQASSTVTIGGELGAQSVALAPKLDVIGQTIGALVPAVSPGTTMADVNAIIAAFAVAFPAGLGSVAASKVKAV